MTTLTALARPRVLLATGPLRRGFLLGLFGTLLVASFLAVGLTAGVGLSHADRIMPGVRVAGVELGGLSRSAAAARLEASLPSLTAGTLNVAVDGVDVEVPVADIGRAYQVEAMLERAFAVARDGNPLADAIDRIRLLARPPELSAASAGTADAVDRVTQGLVARFAVAPVDGSVTYDPENGFVAVPASDGAALDATEVRAALAAFAATPSTAPTSLSFQTSPVAPQISTRDAGAAAIAARWMTATPLALEAAGKPLSLEPAALAGALTFGTRDGVYGPIVVEAALTALVEPLAPQVASAAKDATFTWNANGISGVVPGATGRELDVAGSVRAVADALRTRGGGSLTPSAALSVSVTQPALTTENAQAAMAKMTRMSTWTTFYTPGESNYWGANISIPARDLDTLVIAPGEWFSFWNDIGPVTVARGYG
ncbi:MAG TPA: peptidoglycan binding domain-containing protein, partial [Candidatus Limnocylindria bacterium]|nr:peptidoglycan binding domain-containing protein [Candidatus Limnocylindria bacterium]